jgi:S-adenosylmethionine:tRNA ribosyltransferase-isomerase
MRIRLVEQPMTLFNRTDYTFDLPEHLIAQKPADRRDQSRLMVLEGQSSTSHTTFANIAEFFKPGDVLVLNQTKVMKARLRAVKENGTQIEVFILTLQTDPSEVPVLLRPAKRVKEGMRLHFQAADVWATCTAKKDGGQAIMAFENQDALIAAIEKDGEVPLPPYIHRDQPPNDEDIERYQTVYARDLGAVAAPTAGLHFTENLLEQLEAKGVHIAKLTLHVGIGTFKPLVVDDIREHDMDFEPYNLPEESAALLNAARKDGRRIIAVGTTSTRCLESCVENDQFKAGPGTTNLYIYPGYQYRAINGLITNFHLPGSSLILLVSALMGIERMRAAYLDAIEREYRFYSYGDAMLLLPNEGSPN